MANRPVIHDSSTVKSDQIGDCTTIWQYVVILPGASIGKDCNICSHCFIENDVVIGDRVTIKNGVSLWDGLRVGDDVFIGPNVTFTNDKFPRSKAYPDKFIPTIIEQGASVGGGAVILPGVTIGRGSMIGAGAVVTKSVPPNAIVYGSPARISGYIDGRNGTNNRKESKWTLSENSYENESIGVGDVFVFNFPIIRDIRGDLSVGEFISEIPFTAERYFLVFNVPSEETRGEHAHYKCEQFLICVKGSCVVLVDDGFTRREIKLDTPSRGVYIPPMTWGTQYKYSKDAVLLVFASHRYDPSDYIRTYAQFLEIINK